MVIRLLWLQNVRGGGGAEKVSGMLNGGGGLM